MTAVPRPATGAAALALALVLAGCSLSVGDEDDPTPTDAGGSAAQPDGGPTGERTSAAAGPGPEELSAELLERARAADRRPAVGSVSGEVEGESVTMEVVSVRRTSDAVLAELRLSSDAAEVRIGVTTFNSPPLESISFVRGLTLDDEAGGTRYRPLVFDDGRDGCVCPYLPLVLGPQAQTLQAMYPPLPESVTTVTVNLGDVLVVPDVEIEDAPGTDG